MNRHEREQSSVVDDVDRIKAGFPSTAMLGCMSDLRFKGRGFDYRSGQYQVTTSMGGYLRTSKPSKYITITKINSAFHPFGIDKSSTDLSDWG